jgi:Flp pilus assembly protein TadG
MMRRLRGQATVELALVTLVLAVLVVGLVSLSEIVQAQIGLTAVAEEAALAAALAPSVDTVEPRGRERGTAVADGYALRNGSLSIGIQVSDFAPGQRVRAVATYELTAQDIPLLTVASVNLSETHVEVIPQFRGVPPAGG